MKLLIQKLIQNRAKRILAKYHPTIVAVTGSVGKTSTREAIATVLAERFRVRSPEGNYNNEFGVPLTVIGVTSPGRSMGGWLKVLWQAERLLWSTDTTYPNLLVLEYGSDHPGDIAALCELARPNVAVWTAVSPVHVANFSNLDALAQEKSELIRRVRPDGLAVLNADDAMVMSLRDQSVVPICTYGFTAGADVRALNYVLFTREDLSFEPGEKVAKTVFDLTHEGDQAPVTMSLIGRSQVSAGLAATAVGIHFGLSLAEMARRLAEVPAQPGRLFPIPGIKGSLILDDSYNAAPASVVAALDTLASFSPVESARRIAVLGNMAELGKYSESEHRMIGLRVASIADVLVTVGEPARDIARGAKEAGMDETHIVEFTDSVEAGRWLDAQVKKGDIVLVKGSQSVRMEKAVKDIMAEPQRAGEFLCRQYGKWLEE